MNTRRIAPVSVLLIATTALTLAARPSSAEPLRGDTMQSRTVQSRAALRVDASWNDFPVRLVIPGTNVAPGRVERITGKYVRYLPPGSDLVILGVITDPHTGYTYATEGLRTFYVSFGDSLMGCTVGTGTVALTRSFSRVPSGAASPSAVIEQLLSSLSDEELFQRSRQATLIGLASGVPAAFFTQNSAGGSGGALAAVTAVDVTDGILRMDLLSHGGKYAAELWISLADGKLVRSMVDGKEWPLRSLSEGGR